VKILVTGASKGLGEFLSEKWKCDRFIRDSDLSYFKRNNYDLIVHCAFNSKNNPGEHELAKYFYDNVILTHEILKLPAKRFVFISSIDVYPKNFDCKSENVEIDITQVSNIYGQCKLVCEDMVSHHENYLILRCGGIIGKNKIPNSIATALKHSSTSLTENSTVNYVNQKTIADIIEVPDITCKTVNVVSDVSMPIKDLREIVSDIRFGNYEYHSINVVTCKLKKTFPNIKIPSSKDVLLDVLGK
jgi:dTDP-4-dehydrorhamnose reductase